MLVDIDMIIEAGPADFPFRKDISLDGQRTQRRIIQLFEQLSSCAPDTAQNTPVIEIGELVCDRRVNVAKAVEHTMTQSPEKPALNDAHRCLDFRLVTRTARPCRQNGTAVVSRHSGVASIDLRIKQAGLDDGDFGIVRTSSAGTPPKASSASRWHSIQSGRVSLQRACAKERLDAPSTATNRCACRVFPDNLSITTVTVSPA